MLTGTSRRALFVPGALLAVAVAACQPQTGAFAFVTVDVDPTVGDTVVYQLRSRATNGADSNEALLPAVAAGGLAFPKSYIIELGSRTGQLQLTVEGMAADGQVLLRGLATPATIRPGEQLSLSVRLKRACAAGAYCKNVPGEESLRLVSSDTRSWTGCAVAAAPVSGGTAADIIIGARGVSEVYVVFNDPLPTGSLSLQSGPPDVWVHMACCGDGICAAPDETAASCPADCAATCIEDGVCDVTETCGSCPADCGPCELSASRCASSGLGGSLLAAPLGTGTSFDLVLGAAAGDAVYVLHGPLAASATRPLDVRLGVRDQSAIPYTLIKGPADSSFGYALAIGDLTGPGGAPDGLPDLVIGAQRYSAGGARVNGGAVFVVPNALLRSGFVDVEAHLDEIAVVLGASAGEFAGVAVAVGDVVGAAGADLIVGAYRASPAVAGATRTEAGAVYAVAGPLAPGVLDLGATPAALTIVGATAGARLGTAVAAGDLTGDGADDLALGAPGAAAVYLLAGPLPAGSVRDLAEATAYSSVVRNGGDAFGAVVTLGDVTGDEVVDVLVGAPAATEAGRLIVLTWGAGLPAVLDFGGRPADVAGAEIVITGVPGSKLGSAAAPVDGNVGGAGGRELLIGAAGTADAFYVRRTE